MITTVEKPHSWKRILNVEIPTDEFENAFNTKLRNYRKDIKLPGFRRGKATPELIKSRFGGAIRMELVEELVQKSYEDACRENDITPVSQANVTNLKATPGEALSFTVETEIDPEIEIKGYLKLKIKPAPDKIKNREVDKVIQDLRERLATYSDIDRPAKNGDYVTIEYQKVIVDGQERTDVSSPQHPIQVGASEIKSFDKALIGCKADDIIEPSISFPKDYGDAEIAGKTGQFIIKVLKVQEMILPEINEEFLKKIGSFDNEEALREQVTKDLEARELERAKNEAINKAIDKLIKDNPFEIPPARIEQYIDYMMEQAKRYARSGEKLPEREEFARRYRDIGIKAIKRHRIIDYIAHKENIKASQEEVDEQIRAMATQYNQDFETLKQALRKNGTTNRIREDIRERKTLDFLIGEHIKPAE